MATLKIKNNFYMSAQGVEDIGKQGSATDDVDDYFNITVSGLIHKRKLTLATGTAKLVFDASVDTPANPVYFFFWCDEASYIQFITASVNFTVQVAAKTPFVLPSNNILAAANTTPLSGSAPSVVAVAKVYVQQNSGNTANALFAGVQ